MKSQSQVEHLLKDIHLMVSQCEKVNGNPDKIIMEKHLLFEKLEQINLCMYDLMDQYEVTNQSKSRAQRELKEQGEAIIENASIMAEDVYGASVFYADDAIARLIRIMEGTQKSMEDALQEVNQSLEEQKKVVRGNQLELQEQLFDMKDSNLYLNILTEHRRKINKQQMENKIISGEKTIDVMNPLQEASYKMNAQRPEIKINQAYFEKTGKTYMPEGAEEPSPVTPEIKVALDADYFKWKNGEAMEPEQQKSPYRRTLFGKK